MPFCPACLSEYRPEFTRCADCSADLVAAAPPAPPKSALGRLVNRLVQTVKLVTLLGVLLALGGCGVGVWFTSRHARDCETSAATMLAGVTRVKVWAAGSRRSPDSFCGACSLGHPTEIYETADLVEIAALKSSLKFSAVWSPLPEMKIAACGPITIDFLRDESLVLSVNLNGQDVDVSLGARWSAPLSWGGRWELDAWLARHNLREKAYQIRSDLRNANLR